MHQIKKLHKIFDKLQLRYGDSSLNAVYGTGCLKNAKAFFVFMNPTMRNIATSKDWKGLRAQFIGTKSIWNFLVKIKLFDEALNEKIQSKTAKEWTPELAKEVYEHVADKKLYITNLSKAAQLDARPLKDEDFREYLSHLKEEIFAVNPKVIISFGNQVSSILLGEKINVSKCRKKAYKLKINGKIFKVYPIYYPLGLGFRNIKKAVEDLNCIMKNNGNK